MARAHIRRSALDLSGLPARPVGCRGVLRPPASGHTSAWGNIGIRFLAGLGRTLLKWDTRTKDFKLVFRTRRQLVQSPHGLRFDLLVETEPCGTQVKPA